MILFRWVRALYDKTLRLAEHPKAVYWLAALSFAESSFFPIPPDVVLLPLCLAHRKRAFFLATVCTLSSLLGGLLGYLIGAFAFDAVGAPILEFCGIVDSYDQFQAWYAQNGSIMVLVAGFTPIPYKVITLSAGVFRFSLPEFLLLSLLSRGLRFGLEAWIVFRFGEPALVFIDRHFNKLTLIAGVLFVGGFIALKFFLGH